ncbi:MAG: hypothetical protein IT237_10350 [Bacteroidia bacterium]|nr:hypothetical protein [Bacteroidia bacterium]
MKFLQRIKYIITLFLIIQSTFAQLDIGKQYGFNIGFVSAIGTHFQRFGFVAQGYVVHEFAQINASIRVYNNFKNLGPKGEYVEYNAALGFCLGYGKKINEINYFISSVGNQTGFENSVAYSYNVWVNKMHTSQVTGIIALQFQNISFITENDLLAKPTLDRYRTGAFLIQYQNQYFQYALNCTMWTGQMGTSVRNDSLYPSIGYLSTENGKYSLLSHGLLSAQVKYADKYGQYLQANAGIDAEQVRNTVQNKWIHDMPLIPKKWIKNKNLHIPMIDSEGKQYLYRPNQKIHKAKLFLNEHTSANVFY